VKSNRDATGGRREFHGRAGLPDIVERFATGFDHIPTTIEGLEVARLIAPGL
jgi:hypothetical protein